MGIRYLSKERADNLIEIYVYAHGCIDGIYNCEGRFNTQHIFSDGFKPDEGWYHIADYMIDELKFFRKRGVIITYSDTCKYVQKLVEENDR